MSKATRKLTRGARRRNDKLASLRRLVSKDYAIVGIDLAEERQAAVVADHDSATLGRRMFKGSVWVIDDILDWATPIARQAGYSGVVVACEPTGHRWKAVLERSGTRGVPMVCVATMLVAKAREGEDLTRNRADFSDATIIARLTAELRCHVPYAPEGPWARLRHLGARRNQLIDDATAARQAVVDLLCCAWPTVLETAARPADSLTWRAAMAVSCHPREVISMSLESFAEAVRTELLAWGGQGRRCWRILEAIYDAARCPGGIDWDRDAVAERAGFLIADWRRVLAELARIEATMIAVLDELHLRHLVETIPGLSAVGAAQILAETGDPTRFDGPRTWVKHAGICPRANESGKFKGQTRVSRRGRPGLRTAAWRAIWGALPGNAVWAARHHHLTTRADKPLKDGQARIALAASLLRQLYVVVTKRVAWDPAIAAGGQKGFNTAA
jgi:transposase